MKPRVLRRHRFCRSPQGSVLFRFSTNQKTSSSLVPQGLQGPLSGSSRKVLYNLSAWYAFASFALASMHTSSVHALMTARVLWLPLVCTRVYTLRIYMTRPFPLRLKWRHSYCKQVCRGFLQKPRLQKSHQEGGLVILRSLLLSSNVCERCINSWNSMITVH